MGTPRSKTRLYKVWSEMKRRCNNPNDNVYKYYGGRGITYHPDWEKFDNFCKWALENGYVPDQPRGMYTLDRIDNDGNYTPDNCRWVSQKKQSDNTSKSIYVEYNGERHTLSEWEEITGLLRDTIRARLFNYKYETEDALTQPIFQKHKKLIEYNGIKDTKKGWSKRLGLSKNAVEQRLKRGWSLQDALTKGKMY